MATHKITMRHPYSSVSNRLLTATSANAAVGGKHYYNAHLHTVGNADKQILQSNVHRTALISTTASTLVGHGRTEEMSSATSSTYLTWAESHYARRVAEMNGNIALSSSFTPLHDASESLHTPEGNNINNNTNNSTSSSTFIDAASYAGAGNAPLYPMDEDGVALALSLAAARMGSRAHKQSRGEAAANATAHGVDTPTFEAVASSSATAAVHTLTASTSSATGDAQTPTASLETADTVTDTIVTAYPYYARHGMAHLPAAAAAVAEAREELRRLALVLPYEPEDVVGEVRSGRVAFATDSGTGQYTAAVRAYASTVASAFAGDHELDDAEQWRWLPLLGLPSAPAPPMLQRRESTAIHANGGLELLRGNNDAAQLQPVYVTAAAQARATEVSMTPSAAYRDTAAPLPPSAARIDPSSVTLAALAQHARAVPTQPPVAPGMSQGVWTGGEPGSSARWPSLEPLVLAPAPRTHADAARRGQLQLLRSGRHGGTQGRRGGRGVVIDVGDAGVVGVVGADEECVARVGTRSGSAGGVGARASRRSVGVGAGTANGGVGGRTWARGMSHVSGQRQFSTTSGGHRGDDKSSARSGDVGSQTSQRANREHRVGGASEDEGGEAVYDNVVYDGDAVDGDFDAADDMYEVGVSGREGTVGGRREDREGLSDRDREIKDRQVERAEDEYDNVVYDRAVDEADMELEEEETVGYPDVVEEGREPGSETKRGADGKTGANNAAGAGQGRNTASGSNNTASVDGKNKAQEDVATEDVDLSYEQTVYDGEATYGGFSDAEAEGEGGLGGGTEAEYEQGEPMSGEKENGNGRGNGRGGDRGSGHGGAVGGGGGSGAGGATAGGTAAAAAGGHRAAATQSTSAMGAGAPQRQQAAASGQRGQSPGRNAPGQPREKTDGSVDESSRGGVDKGDAEGAGDAGDGPVGRVPFDGVAHTVGGARGVGTTVDSGSSRGRESGSGVGAGVGETVERGRGGIDSGDARVVDGVDGGGDRARTLFRSGGLSSTATASSKGTHTTGKATAAAASDIPSTGNSGKKTQTQKNSGSKASDAGKPKVPRERTSVSVSVPHADAEYVRESAQAAAIMRALHGMPDEADEAEGAVEADAKKEAAESAKRAVSAVSQGDGDRSDSELLGGSDSPPLRRAKGKGSAKADTKVGKKKASASVEGNVTHAGSGSASSRAQPRGATPTRVVVATREINVAVTAQARVIEQPTPPFGAMGAQAQLLAADLTRALVGQMIQQATQPRALMQVLQRGAAAAAREQRASRADMLGADVRGAGLQGPVAIGKHGEDAGDVAEAEDARVPRNDKNKQRNLRGTPSAGVQRQRGAASDTTTTAATVAAGGVASTAASHAAAARRAALGGAATAEADTEPTSRSDATRIQHQAGDGKTAGSSGNAGSRSNGTDGAPAKRVPGDVSEDADDSSTTSSSDSSSEGESGAAGEEGSDTRYDREPLGGGHTVRTSHNGKGHAGNREGAGVKSSKTTFSGNTKIPKVLVRGLHSMSGDGKSGSGTAASTTPTPVAAASAAAPASGSASAVVAAAPAVKGNVAGVNVRVDDTADARTNNSTNSVAATSSTNATTTSTTSSPAASTPKHDAAKRSDPQASAKKGSAVGALDIAAAVSALTKHMRSLSAASKADSKKTGTNSTSSADTSTATKPASSAGSGAGAARKSTGTVHTPRITPPSTSAAASKASSHASAPSSVLGDARISAALHMPLKVTVPRPQAYAAVPSRAAAGPAIETQPATTGITRGRQTSPRAQKPAQGSIDANGDVAHHAPATAAAPIRASADTWPSQSASAASPYRRLSLPIVLRTRRASAMQQSQSPSMAGARAAANRDDAAPIAAGTGTEATRGAQRHSNKGRSSVTTTASSAGLRASSQPAPTRRSVQVAANPVASAARVAAHATPVAQRVTATFRAIRAQREQRRRASERAQQTVQRRSDAGEVGATQTTKSSVTAPIQAQIESKPAVAAPLAAGLALTQALTSTQSANATTAASISAISGTRVPLRVELLPLLSLEARLEHLVAALEQTSTESVSSKATRTSKEPSVKNAEGQDVLQAAAATLRNSVSSELLRTDRALLLAALQVLLRARTAAGEAITHKTGSDASGQKGDARPSSQTRGAVNVTVAQLRAWATKELSEPRATMPAAVVATRVDELPAVPTNAAALRLALLRRGVDEAVVKAAVRLPGEAKVNKHGVARSDSDVVYMRQNDADTHDIALTLPLPRSAEATVASGAKSVSTPRNNTHEQTSDARHNQRGVRGRVYVPENPFDSLTSGKNTKIPKSRPALPLSLLRFSNGRGAVDEVALMERGTLADIEMYMQHMQEVQATSQGADGARGYARTRNGGLYEDSDQSLFSTGGLTYNFSSSSDTDGDGVYQRDARALSRQLDAWLARSALVNDDDGAMESDEEDSWTREVVPGVSTFTREDADIYRHGRPYDAGVGARDADGEVYRSVAARMAADEAAVRQGYTPRAYDAYASELDMEDEYGGLYNEYGLGDEDGYGVSSEEEVVRTMAEAWGDREERSQRPSALRRRGDSSSGASGSWSAAGGAGTKSNTAATRKAASVSTGSGANGVWDIPASDGIQAPPARSPTRTNTTATKAVENDSSETESEDVFARWLKEKENSLLRRALTGADAVDMGATRADVFSVQDPAAVGEGRAGASASNGGFVYSKYGRFRRLQSPTTTDAPATDSNSTAGRVTSTRASTLATSAETDTLTDALYGLPTSDELNNSVDQRNVGNGDRSDGSNSSANSGKLSQNSAAAAGERRNGAANGNSKGTTVAPAKAAALRSAQPFTATPSHGYGESDARDITATVAQAQQAASSLNPAAAQATPTAAVLVGVQRTGDRSPVGHEGHFTRPAGSRTPLEHEVGTYVGMATDTPPTSSAAITADGKAKAADASAGDNSVDAGVASGLAALRAARYRRHVARYYQQAVQKQGGQGSATGTCASAATAVGESTAGHQRTDGTKASNTAATQGRLASRGAGSNASGVMGGVSGGQRLASIAEGDEEDASANMDTSTAGVWGKSALSAVNPGIGASASRSMLPTQAHGHARTGGAATTTATGSSATAEVAPPPTHAQARARAALQGSNTAPADRRGRGNTPQKDVQAQDTRARREAAAVAAIASLRNTNADTNATTTAAAAAASSSSVEVPVKSKFATNPVTTDSSGSPPLLPHPGVPRTVVHGLCLWRLGSYAAFYHHHLALQQGIRTHAAAAATLSVAPTTRTVLPPPHSYAGVVMARLIDGDLAFIREGTAACDAAWTAKVRERDEQRRRAGLTSGGAAEAGVAQKEAARDSDVTADAAVSSNDTVAARMTAPSSAHAGTPTNTPGAPPPPAVPPRLLATLTAACARVRNVLQLGYHSPVAAVECTVAPAVGDRLDVRRTTPVSVAARAERLRQAAVDGGRMDLSASNAVSVSGRASSTATEPRAVASDGITQSTGNSTAVTRTLGATEGGADGAAGVGAPQAPTVPARVPPLGALLALLRWQLQLVHALAIGSTPIRDAAAAVAALDAAAPRARATQEAAVLQRAVAVALGAEPAGEHWREYFTAVAPEAAEALPLPSASEWAWLLQTEGGVQGETGPESNGTAAEANAASGEVTQAAAVPAAGLSATTAPSVPMNASSAGATAHMAVPVSSSTCPPATLPASSAPQTQPALPTPATLSSGLDPTAALYARWGREAAYRAVCTLDTLLREEMGRAAAEATSQGETRASNVRGLDVSSDVTEQDVNAVNSGAKAERELARGGAAETATAAQAWRREASALLRWYAECVRWAITHSHQHTHADAHAGAMEDMQASTSDNTLPGAADTVAAHGHQQRRALLVEGLGSNAEAALERSPAGAGVDSVNTRLAAALGNSGGAGPRASASISSGSSSGSAFSSTGSEGFSSESGSGNESGNEAAAPLASLLTSPLPTPAALTAAHPLFQHWLALLSTPPPGAEAVTQPREVVARLDDAVVGQAEAKRAVAIALRNRLRRARLGAEGEHISPKNMLMVGPTGSGKTELARTLARITKAPFVKVEATKYTETGFHGKDVDSIVKDLVDAALALLKGRQGEERKGRGQAHVHRALASVMGIADGEWPAIMLEVERRQRAAGVRVGAATGAVGNGLPAAGGSFGSTVSRASSATSASSASAPPQPTPAAPRAGLRAIDDSMNSGVSTPVWTDDFLARTVDNTQRTHETCEGETQAQSARSGEIKASGMMRMSLGGEDTLHADAAAVVANTTTPNARASTMSPRTSASASAAEAAWVSRVAVEVAGAELRPLPGATSPNTTHSLASVHPQAPVQAQRQLQGQTGVPISTTTTNAPALSPSMSTPSGTALPSASRTDEPAHVFATDALSNALVCDSVPMDAKVAAGGASWNATVAEVDADIVRRGAGRGRGSGGDGGAAASGSGSGSPHSGPSGDTGVAGSGNATGPSAAAATTVMPTQVHSTLSNTYPFDLHGGMHAAIASALAAVAADSGSTHQTSTNITTPTTTAASLVPTPHAHGPVLTYTRAARTFSTRAHSHGDNLDNGSGVASGYAPMRMHASADTSKGDSAKAGSDSRNTASSGKNIADSERTPDSDAPADHARAPPNPLSTDPAPSSSSTVSLPPRVQFTMAADLTPSPAAVGTTGTDAAAVADKPVGILYRNGRPERYIPSLREYRAHLQRQKAAIEAMGGGVSAVAGKSMDSTNSSGAAVTSSGASTGAAGKAAGELGAAYLREVLLGRGNTVAAASAGTTSGNSDSSAGAAQRSTTATDTHLSAATAAAAALGCAPTNVGDASASALGLGAVSRLLRRGRVAVDASGRVVSWRHALATATATSTRAHAEDAAASEEGHGGLVRGLTDGAHSSSASMLRNLAAQRAAGDTHSTSTKPSTFAAAAAAAAAAAPPSLSADVTAQPVLLDLLAPARARAHAERRALRRGAESFLSAGGQLQNGWEEHMRRHTGPLGDLLEGAEEAGAGIEAETGTFATDAEAASTGGTLVLPPPLPLTSEMVTALLSAPHALAWLELLVAEGCFDAKAVELDLPATVSKAVAAAVEAEGLPRVQAWAPIAVDAEDKDVCADASVERGQVNAPSRSLGSGAAVDIGSEGATHFRNISALDGDSSGCDTTALSSHTGFGSSSGAGRSGDSVHMGGFTGGLGGSSGTGSMFGSIGSPNLPFTTMGSDTTTSMGLGMSTGMGMGATTAKPRSRYLATVAAARRVLSLLESERLQSGAAHNGQPAGSPGMSTYYNPFGNYPPLPGTGSGALGGMTQGELVQEAIRLSEREGIVFLDEIDKICVPAGTTRHSGDASDEGVQRDLLPIIEGSTVTTPHGPVNTSKILFIAAGAFHQAKPSDLLPELQGRLPIRITLSALTVDELYKVLCCTDHALLQQHAQLFRAEGVRLLYTNDAILALARAAVELNKTNENIGARRLHGLVERVLEEASFDASEWGRGSVFLVTQSMVEAAVASTMSKSDLKRYCL